MQVTEAMMMVVFIVAVAVVAKESIVQVRCRSRREQEQFLLGWFELGRWIVCARNSAAECRLGFMAVTNNIREIREQRGIYQDDLASAIGYSTKTVGRIERGDSTPSAEFMLRISKYFNMLVEDVFHVED